MRVNRKMLISLAVVAGLLLVSGVATAVDIPLKNWPVPAYSKGGQRTTLSGSDTSFPAIFVPVSPCRVADTRGNGFTGAYGPPSLVGGGPARSFPIPSSPTCTGIPASARAFSLNFTIVAPGGTPAGGYITVFPTGGTQPVVSTQNFGSGSIIANAAIVPAGTSGGVSVFVNFTTDLIIDINGYFLGTSSTGSDSTMNPGEYVGIRGNTQPGYIGLLYVVNTAATSSTAAIRGISSNPTSGSYATSGEQSGATGVTYGLYGTNASGTAGAAGVFGSAATGKTFGVYGQTAATSLDAAGVVGYDGTGVTWTAAGSLNGPAGVYGYGRSGVAGATSSTGAWGVIGMKLTSPTTLGPFGVLGYSTYGVFSFGDMGSSGAKPFVEPHPTDPTKVVRYVAMEGPEAGTYFRGTARLVGGEAIISVPETFRWVTDESGMTVQVTAVGSPASLYVESENLNQIVIRSQTSANATFHYLVQGVRKAYKDWQVVADNVEYMPASPTATMPAVFADEIKRRLVANGTYNADGTVNMQTAERMGWAQKWRDEEKARQDAARHPQNRFDPGSSNSSQ